jgi:ParB-like chromosome segregation protein Spo0J
MARSLRAERIEREIGAFAAACSARPEVASRVRLVRPDPDEIWPWNDAFDAARVARIADGMGESGWVGRPLVVVASGAGKLRALTGSHRLAAAELAGLAWVPVVAIDLPDGWRSRWDGIFRSGRLVDDAQEVADLLERDGADRLVVDLIRDD